LRNRSIDSSGVKAEKVEPFSDDFVNLFAGPEEEVGPATCGWSDIGNLARGMTLPPGPPGLRRMVLFPFAEALVASILMRGIENVLSEDLLE